MFLKMWITRLWILLAILVIVTGVAIWAVFFKPPRVVATEVTKVVTQVVERPVEKVVTVVVERTVVVQATPVPATPTPTKVVTPMPDRVDKLSTVVAQLSAQLAGGSVQAQAVQPITVTAPVTVSENSAVTAMAQITATSVMTQGVWSITLYPGATAEMRSWQFRSPDPKTWKVFPNVDNGVYKAADGVEYGMAESVFCQQGLKCDVIVSARHYRLITGDYNTVFGKCAVDGGAGCALLIVNVGDQTVAWRDQTIDAGFTVTGRYWNGGKLGQAIWAVASHAAYNMLNLSGESTNAGANCSSPSGCQKVKVIFVVVSGTEILMRGETLVSR